MNWKKNLLQLLAAFIVIGIIAALSPNAKSAGSMGEFAGYIVIGLIVLIGAFKVFKKK